jgi:hypothetical protein
MALFSFHSMALFSFHSCCCHCVYRHSHTPCVSPQHLLTCLMCVHAGRHLGSTGEARAKGPGGLCRFPTAQVCCSPASVCSPLPSPPPAPSTADAPHFYLPPARPPVPADPAAPAPHSLPSAPPQPTARPPGRPCQLFSCLHSSRLNPTLRPWLPWRPCTSRSNNRFPLQRPCAPPLPPPPPSFSPRPTAPMPLTPPHPPSPSLPTGHGLGPSHQPVQTDVW